GSGSSTWQQSDQNECSCPGSVRILSTRLLDTIANPRQPAPYRMKEDAMLQQLALASVTATVMALGFSVAQSASPNGVKALDPPGAIKAEGTWSLGARAGDFIFVAGMQGIDPATNTLVQDPQARIRQALLNIRFIAQSEGASLQDCVRITVYVSDLHRFAPMVDKAQAELWGKPPYPPRTMIEVQRLFDDDIVEIDSVFYAPLRK